MTLKSLEKTRNRTVHELPRKTSSSLGAKLLTASTALRAYRNGHLGTLVLICEAWEPVRNCFFERIDFKGLSQIIAQSKKQKYVTSLGHRWKKTMPWRSADVVFVPGAPRNRCSAFTLLSMRLCEYWCTIFRARIEGERHHLHEAILRYVQKAPDDIRWKIDRNEFDELVASKKESAPGPVGLPKNLYRCAGGLGSQFLHKAYKHVAEGGPVPAQFAASRTVLIPKSSDVDNPGRIVRSPEALRPLTLCNCDCKILTTAICRGLRWCEMYTSISVKANDG